MNVSVYFLSLLKIVCQRNNYKLRKRFFPSFRMTTSLNVCGEGIVGGFAANNPLLSIIIICHSDVRRNLSKFYTSAVFPQLPPQHDRWEELILILLF